MKTNKFFATALAALALIGFTSCEPTNEPDTTALELSQSSISLKVGETATITANVTVDKWETNDATVATVADGVVTAIKEGNAIISATANGTTKTCVVLVTSNENGGGNGTTAAVKGSQIWPVILDGTTAESVASKVVASFAPDEVGKFLYVWEGTYAANDNPTGKNFYGNTDGFLAMTVGNVGWSGAGFFISSAAAEYQAEDELRKAIVADPDSYFLHIAIKSTDQASHTFYFMNNDQTKFVLGSNAFDGGEVIGDFTRDGAWYEFDIPMSRYAAVLADRVVGDGTGTNVFVLLSGGQQGVQLNLDAVYFYKK